MNVASVDMAQTVRIQYPVALNDLGVLAKIEDAPRQRGLRYSCVHCSDRMSAVVRVTQQKPHFRHTKSVVCDPDLVLHSTAIEIIRDAHNTAQSTNSPYLLTRPCKRNSDYDVKGCPNNATEINLADGWQSKTEKSIVEGTRSDLIFSHNDGRQTIIEVVNTHPMEQETETAYRRSGIPVAVVWVKWETVNRLSKGIHTQESRNFANDECAGCESERLKAEDDFKRRCTIVDRQLAKMKRQRFSRPKFQPFYEARPEASSDKATPMFVTTQRKVFANAIILTELGFEQSKKKPYIFYKIIYRTPGPPYRTQDVTIFADLGGSEEPPIYKDTAASLYTSLTFKPKNESEPKKDPKINDYIVKKFGERLQKEGVQIRSGSIDVNPVSRVNPEILNRMLQYRERVMCQKTPDKYCFHPDRCRESGCYLVNRRQRQEMPKPHGKPADWLCMECKEYFASTMRRCPKCS